MSLVTQTDLLTLKYAFNGQPFVQVGSPNTMTLGYFDGVGVFVAAGAGATRAPDAKFFVNVGSLLCR